MYVEIGKGLVGLRVGRSVRGSELFVGAFVLVIPAEEGNGATFVDEDDGGEDFSKGEFGLDDGGDVATFGGAPDESVGGAVRMTLGSKYAHFGQLPSARHCRKTVPSPSQPSKLSKLIAPISLATLQ